MPLPNNDYTMRRGGYSKPAPVGSTAAAGGISCFGLIVLWLVLKVAPVIILIQNVIWFIQALQHGTVQHFDFTWLVISAALFIIL